MKEKKFAPKNPEEDAVIVDALISGSEETFQKAGGNDFRGLSKKEALEDQAIRQEKKRAKTGEEEGGAPEATPIIEQELRMDEKNPEWVRNLEKDSVRGKFYQFLEKNFPEFRLEITVNEKNPDMMTVRATPYETDREVLRAIESNPIFRVLVVSRAGGRDIGEILEIGHKLENEGELPEGTTERSLAKYYAYEIEQFKKYMSEKKFEGDQEQLQKQIETYTMRLKELGEEPLPDGELEIFFLQLINQEMGRER